jgi:arginine decarboxylase
MSLVPKKIFFVKGKGCSKNSELRSFEQALREAGIEKFNIVRVSSIIPPNCKEISKDDGLKELTVGQIVYSVLSKISSNRVNDLICASIGAAKPLNKGDYGYLSEKHSINENPEDVAKATEELAVEMLATTHGFSFDSHLNYEEKKGNYKVNEKIVETKKITESFLIERTGEWATVIAAAIFIT